MQSMAPFINSVAAYVPPERHENSTLESTAGCVAGVCLPRAIAFATSLYSIGLPPEFIGMSALNQLNDTEWGASQEI